MTAHTDDLKTKLTPEAHRQLGLLCMANGESMQDRVRLLIDDYIASELHKHTLRTRLLRSEGNGGAEGGKL